MKEIFINIMMAIFGLIFIIFGSTGLLGIFGIFFGFIGGMLMFIPIFRDIGIITGEGLLPFWKAKKPGEKISFTITRNGKILFLPVVDKHEGVLYYNGKFFANDQGEPLQTRSGRDACLSISGLGITLSPKMMGYVGALRKNQNIPNYDEAIKKYLTPADYQTFLMKFRGKNNPKNRFEVEQEIDFLIKKEPKDFLKEHIIGETFAFRDFLHYLRYAYNTLSVKNAIERERLDIMQRMDDYSAKAKQAINYAIAFIIIMVGLGIAAYIFSGVDMGGMLNFFGG